MQVADLLCGSSVHGVLVRPDCLVDGGEQTGIELRGRAVGRRPFKEISVETMDRVTGISSLMSLFFCQLKKVSYSASFSIASNVVTATACILLASMLVVRSKK